MMNSTIKLSIFLLLTFFAFHVFGQRTQQDTMYAYHAPVPVVIDGKADDPCWANAEWFAIDQVWIPYGVKMKEGDFEGRFKLAWDSLYIYLLAEIVDDSLSDYHSNPLQNWWDDDCLEIFIDENRSKGDHEKNYNAFAYHVSLFYDAIDMDKNGNGINLKDNIEVVMDTVGNNTYIWEVAIKNYSDAFNHNNPEASRIFLHHNKLMGFSLAYCDNDGTNRRENFIGSMYMTQARANDNYKTADFFGSLILIDPTQSTTSVLETVNSKEIFSLYPNPATDKLGIKFSSKNGEGAKVEIRDLSGRVVVSQRISNNNTQINIGQIPAGSYILTLVTDEYSQSKSFVKKYY